MKKVQVFDTTLRDGTQGEHISFSVEDKVRIARRLDEFGVDYIEGGWPGSNPRDINFFDRMRAVPMKHARIVAFGSTRRAANQAEDDPNLMALLAAGTSAVSIFGKSWILHLKSALRISPKENLKLIAESIRFMKAHGREVIYDAEHFFDGFKDNPEYALKTLQTAEEAGADVVALCDTNGGALTNEITEIVGRAREVVRGALGIHAHNDSELAVANTVAAVQAGCAHIQGTFNGYGERCGNANLCSAIPNLQLKLGYECVPGQNLAKITTLSHYVHELANVTPRDFAPFVGRSAFAHKGGIHVSAVMREPSTYEHLQPETVGNIRRVLVSDLSGRSNILFRAREMNLDLSGETDIAPDVVARIKELENQGFQFESADGSFELLVKDSLGQVPRFFELAGFRVTNQKNGNGQITSEAVIKLVVNGEVEHTAAEGEGPVNALDNCLRKALGKFYPELADMHLSDYKVRVLNSDAATAARVRVLIESSDEENSWNTVGVSENIIEASWQALLDSVCYYLLKRDVRPSMSPGRDETDEPALPRRAAAGN